MVEPEAVLAVIRASRPQLRTAHDRVAFALHAAFLASGYTLLASGARAAFDPPRDVPQDEDVGTEGWNDLQDAYAFRYLSLQKKIIDVKCTVLGDLLMVDAAPSDNSASAPAHLELHVKNFAKEGDCRSYSEQFFDLDGILKQFSMLISNWEPKPTALTHAQRREDFGEHEETGSYEPRYQVPRVPALGAGDLMPGGFSDIPPGARFDPFGPPGVPGFEPSRFGRGRRPPGQPHPDLERYDLASRSSKGSFIGERVIAGRVVKESYGASKQQHTFTVEVLWSKGSKALQPLHPLLIKGRNLYRIRTYRQPWPDEGKRKLVLEEKHARGADARRTRATTKCGVRRKVLLGDDRRKEDNKACQPEPLLDIRESFERITVALKDNNKDEVASSSQAFTIAREREAGNLFGPEMQRTYAHRVYQGHNDATSAIKCYICGKIGHFARECRNGNGRPGLCYTCGRPGHIARDCQVKTLSYNLENTHRGR